MWRSLSLFLFLFRFLLCVLNTNAQNTRIIQIFYTQIQKVNSLYKSFFVSVLWIECEWCVCVSAMLCPQPGIFDYYLAVNAENVWNIWFMCMLMPDTAHSLQSPFPLPVCLSVKYLQFEYIFSILHACCVCVCVCVLISNWNDKC